MTTHHPANPERRDGPLDLACVYAIPSRQAQGLSTLYDEYCLGLLDSAFADPLIKPSEDFVLL